MASGAAGGSVGAPRPGVLGWQQGQRTAGEGPQGPDPHSAGGRWGQRVAAGARGGAELLGGCPWGASWHCSLGPS